MRINCLLLASVVLTILFNVPCEGGRIVLRPLSAPEVYRLLRDAGREDAVPEGRVVSQGIAALKGFALGIAKGAGGALLVDLLTSNSTMNMISGMMNGNSNTNGNSNGEMSNQEICFSTRSLNDISDVDTEPQGRQSEMTMTGNGGTGDAATGDNTVANTDAESPVATDEGVAGTNVGENTDANTQTEEAAGDNSGTISDTMTQTGGGAVNCIVIQKPKS